MIVFSSYPVNVPDSDPATKETTGSDPRAAGDAAAGEHAENEHGDNGVDHYSPTEFVPLSDEVIPAPVRRKVDQTRGEVAVTTFEELEERTIGDFRILRRLGVGGMAEVYLAEQISLTRKIALKVLRSEVLSGSNDVLLRRFEQEARAAAALTHQNIVQVHGVGEQDGLHWIAQEYVHGVNLKQYMNRKGPPETSLAIRFAKQIALALQAAAEAGIVHRDVKPENVMVTPKGRVKVADFGLAQLTRDENVHLTQVGMTMGTPLYMSPEQVNGKPTDGRSDLYSLGVTLYHLLAGEPPFKGETALVIAVKHLNERAPRLHDRRADLPRSLCDLVHRLMEKNPADRPADAGEVYEELKRIGRAVADGASGIDIAQVDRPVGESSGWWPAEDRRGLLRHLVWFAAACVVVGAVSAGIGWVTRPGNPLETPPASTSIARQETAVEQIQTAQFLGTEEAYLAVVQNFEKERTARREVAWAKIKLGVFAMSDRRYDEARRRFDEVYTEFESDPQLSGNALAGIAAVESLEGQYAESQQLIVVDLVPMRRQLNSEMERIVEGTIRRNREKLGTAVDGLEDLVPRT